MLFPDTCTGFSFIKKNMETIKMSQFNYDVLKINIHIAECMNKISVAGETYSGIARPKKSTSYPPYNDRSLGDTWIPVRVSGMNSRHLKKTGKVHGPE